MINGLMAFFGFEIIYINGNTNATTRVKIRRMNAQRRILLVIRGSSIGVPSVP
jgi:hypothetical protein